MTVTVNRASVKALLDLDKKRWLSAANVADELAYTGAMKNVSNALSGLFTAGYVEKKKHPDNARTVLYRVKGRGSYKPRETKQKDLPLQDLEVVSSAASTPTTAELMSPEFEILSTSLGKIMADNNNMRAALIKCRDAINHALQG